MSEQVDRLGNIERSVSEHDQIDALNEAVARLRRERDGWQRLADDNGAEAMRRAEQLREAVGEADALRDAIKRALERVQAGMPVSSILQRALRNHPGGQ